jgi:ribosome modulation factor
MPAGTASIGTGVGADFSGGGATTSPSAEESPVALMSASFALLVSIPPLFCPIRARNVRSAWLPNRREARQRTVRVGQEGTRVGILVREPRRKCDLDT